MTLVWFIKKKKAGLRENSLFGDGEKRRSTENTGGEQPV